MKNFLHALPYFLLFLGAAFITPKTFGQCTCSGGEPATPLSYYYIMDTTGIPASVISFPKFDAAMGILSCIIFEDTTSLVTTSGVRNTAASDVTYEFFLNVTNRITGPGVSINQNATRTYGPTLLTAYGTAGDTTSYGPDTLFSNRIHQISTSTVAPYIGASGTVDFDYKITGGGIATDGGLNYRYEIHSKYWGAFRLTYFWCPNLVLSANIRNFTAVSKENIVLLEWSGEDTPAGTGYIVEYSTDGKNFTPVGRSAAASDMEKSTRHQFEYSPGTVAAGMVYFRIKQVNAAGKASYSAVRSVNLNRDAFASLQVYPNPVASKISLQFDRNLNGTYVVGIINVAGQAVYNGNIRMNNSNNARVEIGGGRPSGLYYLKVTDPKTNLSYTSKIMIRS